MRDRDRTVGDDAFLAPVLNAQHSTMIDRGMRFEGDHFGSTVSPPEHLPPTEVVAKQKHVSREKFGGLLPIQPDDQNHRAGS